MKKCNNVPAFPQGCPEMAMVGQTVQETQGMTLRDYFAGCALVGIATLSDRENSPNIEGQAALSYKLADAMLAERSKKPHDE